MRPKLRQTENLGLPGAQKLSSTDNGVFNSPALNFYTTGEKGASGELFLPVRVLTLF